MLQKVVQKWVIFRIPRARARARARGDKTGFVLEIIATRLCFEFPKNPDFDPFLTDVWGAINSDFGSKKVTPKSDQNGHFPEGVPKLTKMTKKTQEKMTKNRKNRRLRHSKISVFPKMAIFDPPKKPTFWTPFFGVFSKSAETVKSHVKSRLAGGPKMGPRDDPKKGVQKVVTILDYPWGFWSKNRHFWSKSGFLGPSNDRFLTTFWTTLDTSWNIYMDLSDGLSKKWQKGVQKLVQKVTPQNMSLFGVPQKKWHPENDKDGQKPIFWPLFDHFLTTFWITLDTSCNIQRVPYMGFSKKW